MTDDQIAALEALSSSELRQRWTEVTGSVVPKVSPKLLRLALAWELQARAQGGLSRETTRELDQRLHVVTVGEDQVVRWDNREWRSLSEVARAITGTRWSGPAFFGLKKKVAA